MPRLRWWMLLSLVGTLLILVRVFAVHLALVGGAIAMIDSVIGLREAVQQTATPVHEQQGKADEYTCHTALKRSRITIFGIY